MSGEAQGESPEVYFSRRWTLVASHRLHAESLSVDDNRAVYGKCNNPYGHGHNYIVQVTVRGPVDAATGMVTNLADLDAFAATELMARFDHQNLNLLPCFSNIVPTTENLCIELWRIFSGYPHARLHRVRVEETGNNAFEYSGE